MQVTWKNITDVSAKLTGLRSARDVFATFNTDDATHRASLIALSNHDYARIVKYADDLSKFIRVGYLLTESEDGEQALRIYDALAGAPADLVPGVAASNAMFAAAKFWRDDKTNLAISTARAKRYIKQWQTKCDEFIPTSSNLALLLTKLGEHDAAIAALRRSVALSDPTVDLDYAGFQPLRKHPDFKKLATIEPTYSPALQTLAMQLALGIPASSQAAAACNVEVIYAEPKPLHQTGFPSGLVAAADATLGVFGELTDGGLLAFWRRAPGKPDDEQPVVIIGSDGMWSVYAASLLGMLTLLANGCSAHAMERLGFFLGETPTEVGAGPSLKKLPAFAAVLAQRAPQIRKRKPDVERDAALALIPAFAQALQPLIDRNTKPTAVTKPARKRK